MLSWWSLWSWRSCVSKSGVVLGEGFGLGSGVYFLRLVFWRTLYWVWLLTGLVLPDLRAARMMIEIIEAMIIKTMMMGAIAIVSPDGLEWKDWLVAKCSSSMDWTCAGVSLEAETNAVEL